MKKWFYIISLSLFLLSPAWAQQRFGNEWVRPNQPYLKCTVEQAGMYRLSYEAIQKANLLFLATDPSHWQVFYRGQEVAIRVMGQDDGRFDKEDYVEFYGVGNDGKQDSLLYRPQQRLHPYQSLFSDQSAYFLTSSLSEKGKRMPELNRPATNATPVGFHVEEIVQAFTNEYTFRNLNGEQPYLLQSYFEPGEGWSGKLIRADSIARINLKLVNRALVNWPLTLSGMVNGRDNLAHQIRVQTSVPTSPPLGLLTPPGFTSQSFNVTIATTGLQKEEVNLQLQAEKNGQANQFSINYLKLTYPQRLDMNNQQGKVFHLPAQAESTALMSISNVPAQVTAFDITDQTQCRLLTSRTVNDQTQIVVDDTKQSRTILLTTQIRQPLRIGPVRFQPIPSSTDYVIITHAALRSSAEAYARYRASAAGGSLRPLVVDIDSVYNQFNYGENSPLAIRRFADYLLANTAVKYLLLIGRANSFPYDVKTSVDNKVPTIGYPGSDILLTAGLGKGTGPNTPGIPTGRINAIANEQVLAYLEKVKQLEDPSQNGLWRKQLVHISGGKSADEAASLRQTMQTLGTVSAEGWIGGQVHGFSKTSTAEVEQINIAPLVNSGVGLITFFGHAGPAVTDLDFGFASDPARGFRNQPHYPLLVFNGCGVGEIFSKYNTLSTDWLLAPQKGAGLVLAHSYFSFEQSTTRYLAQLYKQLFADTASLTMPFGNVHQRLNQVLDEPGGDLYDVSVRLQMLLQGDPALRLYPMAKPDFSVAEKGLFIQSPVLGSPLNTNDSIRVVIPIANLGRYVAGTAVSVRLTIKTDADEVTRILPFRSFRYQDTLRYSLLKNERIQYIEASIDPANTIPELNEQNNQARLNIDWTQARSQTSYPFEVLPDRVSPNLSVLINGTLPQRETVVDLHPHMIVYLLDNNSLVSKDTSAISVYVKSCDTCAPLKLASSLFAVTNLAGNQLQATTQLALQPGHTYQFFIYGRDAARNETQPPYTINLTTLANDEPVTLRVYPNPASTYVQFDLNLPVKELPQQASLTIYNLMGVPILEQSFQAVTGRNRLLWQGSVAGTYPYKVQLLFPNGQRQTLTGTVVWQP